MLSTLYSVYHTGLLVCYGALLAWWSGFVIFCILPLTVATGALVAALEVVGILSFSNPPLDKEERAKLPWYEVACTVSPPPQTGRFAPLRVPPRTAALPCFNLRGKATDLNSSSSSFLLLLRSPS